MAVVVVPAWATTMPAAGQARALGSPVAAGASEFQEEETLGSEGPGRVPGAYEEVPVPPPPGSAGEDDLRYPGTPGAAVRPELAGVPVPSGVATRLRALDGDFQVLAARGGGGIVYGVLGILTGGLSVTVGILLDNRLSAYLYTYGGVGVARGVLNLVLMTNPSSSAITFAHMPMGTADEVRARLEYGERELSGLADRGRLARILDGSMNVAVGLAIVPIYLGPNNFEIRDTFDWFVMIGAAVSAVSGVITLVTTGEAERRWEAYEELRDRLTARGEARRRGVPGPGAAEPAGEDAPDEARSAPSPEGASVTPVLSGSSAGGWLGLQGRF